jgi:hypothetical protein
MLGVYFDRIQDVCGPWRIQTTPCPLNKKKLKNKSSANEKKAGQIFSKV